MKLKVPVNVLPIILFASLGFAVMGYHPGAEDDGVYLSSVKATLNPALFPHDGAFFQLQMRMSAFDTLLAHFIGATGMPVAWAALLWQWISIFLIVWACWSIVRQLFPEAVAQWAGVAMVAAMFTLPVAGTALYLVDQYLHPRNPATALILFGISRIIAGKRLQAIPFLFSAFVLHPLMGAFGISFCCILTLVLSEPLHVRLLQLRQRPVSAATRPFAALIPFGWVFDPPSRIWLDALHTRRWLRLYQWTWYEWLGAIGPLVLFAVVARFAHNQGEIKLARFATAVLIFGIAQQAIAMLLLGPDALVSFSTFEPMRYLHLVYIFMTLIGGAYLGKFALQRRVWRWAIFLILANGGMFLAQRQVFAGTRHFEFPEQASANPWLQTFEWIRRNTPQDAYFALDPNYMAAPGEDYHSFRALAERSALADAVKDTSVVIKIPELAPDWERQVAAQKGWTHFQLADFERLKAEFGVNWVVTSSSPPAGLACEWHNAELSVCRVP